MRSPFRSRLRSRLAAALLLLAVGAAPTLTSASRAAGTGLVGAAGEQQQQVYRPGSANGIPSTPVGDYTGDLLALQAVKVGKSASEPTLGVAKDGTAFFAASKLVVDTPYVWGVAQTDVLRSKDGGTTWQSVQVKVPAADVSVPPGNADPFVWVDPTTDRVFNIDLYAGCSWLNFSDSKGDSWLANPAACGNPVNDHQTIGAGKPRGGLVTAGYPNVVYYCFNRVVDTNCGRSLDGGVVWTPTPTPAFQGYDSANGGLCGGLTGHLETDPDGRVFIPKGHCGKPWIAISEDSGTTWSRVKVSDMAVSDAHLSVASDTAGNLYYVWWDAAKRLPYLSISTDHGRTWGPPMMIAPPGVTETNFPVISAGAPGRIAVNFPSSTDGDRSGSTRPWNQHVVVSANALSDDPIFLSAIANPPADPIHRGNCDGRCAGLWDFQDIVISAQGEAWAAASDDCVGDCVTKGAATALHVGEGIAIRQVGGPKLRD